MRKLRSSILTLTLTLTLTLNLVELGPYEEVEVVDLLVLAH